MLIYYIYTMWIIENGLKSIDDDDDDDDSTGS